MAYFVEFLAWGDAVLTGQQHLESFESPTLDLACDVVAARLKYLVGSRNRELPFDEPCLEVEVKFHRVETRDENGLFRFLEIDESGVAWPIVWARLKAAQEVKGEVS